ncbi:sigma-70 family RNA polymerase sigma factor [uncultured Arcticibacterium sp.]|uniref:sigma-70 family RNA polymerase sigma factor n=1 Tax=uncultured Arcticibacterium sp. TaxID=2173042 RepID=UPI0030F873F9
MALKNYQKVLFPYSYNILGSSEDAKDVVQDVLTNYFLIDKSHIKNEIGYLTKSVINQSINLKKRNAKLKTNEVWLPEAMSTLKPDHDLDVKDILSYSLLVLFEKLTSKERAVFILKEAFDYSHSEIAAIIETTVENARKILSRAKGKLANRKLTYENIALKDKKHVMNNYMQVIQEGDMERLEKLLSKDVKLYAEGTDKIKVVSEYTVGKSEVANILNYVFKKYQNALNIKISEINHQPALLYFKDNSLVTCQVFEIDNQEITAVYSILNPKKIKSISFS